MQMKATIDAKAFSEGLDQVSKTLQKSSYPALSEVSVRVEDGYGSGHLADQADTCPGRQPGVRLHPHQGCSESLPPV